MEKERVFEITGTNEDCSAKRTVEVVGEMTRRCKKCKSVIEGELREFRWDEVRQAYFACGWEFPSGWSHFVYFKADGSGPWQAHFCPWCTVEVKVFIGGE